jgi:hypothetical protein
LFHNGFIKIPTLKVTNNGGKHSLEIKKKSKYQFLLIKSQNFHSRRLNTFLLFKASGIAFSELNATFSTGKPTVFSVLPQRCGPLNGNLS